MRSNEPDCFKTCREILSGSTRRRISSSFRFLLRHKVRYLSSRSIPDWFPLRIPIPPNPSTPFLSPITLVHHFHRSPHPQVPFPSSFQLYPQPHFPTLQLLLLPTTITPTDLSHFFLKPISSTHRTASTPTCRHSRPSFRIFSTARFHKHVSLNSFSAFVTPFYPSRLSSATSTRWEASSQPRDKIVFRVFSLPCPSSNLGPAIGRLYLGHRYDIYPHSLAIPSPVFAFCPRSYFLGLFRLIIIHLNTPPPTPKCQWLVLLPGTSSAWRASLHYLSQSVFIRYTPTHFCLWNPGQGHLQHVHQIRLPKRQIC